MHNLLYFEVVILAITKAFSVCFYLAEMNSLKSFLQMTITYAIFSFYKYSICYKKNLFQVSE